MNTAKKLDHNVSNHSNARVIKRNASGTQMKAVQVPTPQPKPEVGNVSVEAFKALTDAVTELTKKLDAQKVEPANRVEPEPAAVAHIKKGERREFILTVESEKLLDPNHVEIKLTDSANRRYTWIGTTGQAARLRTGNTVVLKGTIMSQGKNGTTLKFCRISEVE